MTDIAVRDRDYVRELLPATSGHRTPLDGMRAIAAFAVLALHTSAETGNLLEPGIFGWLTSRGEIGVPIFFALSGLLLYRPWVRTVLIGGDEPDNASYLLRRGLRILPAYWIVAVIAMLMFNSDRTNDLLGWIKILTLTYVYDTQPWWGPGTGPKGMGQMWSLCVEAAFYVTLPLMAAVLTAYARRAGPSVNARARRLLIGLGLFALLSYVWTFLTYVPEWRPYMGLWLPHAWTWFVPGMAMAVVIVWAHVEPGDDGPVRRLCRNVIGSAGTCWLVAGLIYVIVATPVGGPLMFRPETTAWSALIRLFLYTAFVMFFLAPIAFQPATPTALGRVLGGRVMSYLGRVSYGVFLWQFVVIYLWYQLNDMAPFTGNFIVVFTVSAIACVALGHVSLMLVEEPLRKLPRLLARRGSAVPAAATASGIAGEATTESAAP